MNYASKLKTPLLVLLGAAVMSAGLAAGCADDDDEPGGVDVSHGQVVSALEANAQAAVDDLRGGIDYVRENAGFGVGEYIEVGQGLDEECDDDFWCDEDDDLAVDEEIAELVDDLVGVLKDQVLLEENIESQTATEITYLLGDEHFCNPAQSDHDKCVELVEAAQVRLVVSAPDEGDLDLSLHLGPQRLNPLDVELHRDLVAGQVDLGELSRSVAFLAEIGVDELDADELPETFEGRVRGQLEHSPTQLIATLDVLQKVKVGGNGWDISLDKTSPALQVKVDSAAAAIEALLDLKALDFSLPISGEVDYDVENDTTEAQTYTLAGHLAGLSAQFGYQIDQQRIELKNLGLGDNTSYVDVDGERVLEIDLNAEDGRRLDLAVAETEAGVEVEVDPALDLQLVLKLAQARDILGDVAEWAYDETMRITLNGADKPRLLVNGDEVKVLDGELTLSSTSEGVEVIVPEGQCLLQNDDVVEDGVGGTDAGTDGGDFDGEGEWNEWNEDDWGAEEEAHPFSNIEAGVCQG